MHLALVSLIMGVSRTKHDADAIPVVEGLLKIANIYSL